MRRLLPDPARDVTPDELAAGARHLVDGRPWVGICMVTSVDGSTAVAGRSGALGGATDTAVLGALRRCADVILVGAGTAAAEHYRPPSKPGQRLGVVTARGNVDTTTELFAGGAGFLVTAEDGPRPPGPVVDAVRAGTGRVDLPAALRRLGEVTDAPVFVHVEGGPRLNASLLEADCVDELNLTLSPVVAGGDGSRLVAGAPELLAGLRLVQLAVDDETFLFGRWHRRVGPGGEAEPRPRAG